jgi:hypothetical protein
MLFEWLLGHKFFLCFAKCCIHEIGIAASIEMTATKGHLIGVCAQMCCSSREEERGNTRYAAQEYQDCGLTMAAFFFFDNILEEFGLLLLCQQGKVSVGIR